MSRVCCAQQGESCGDKDADRKRIRTQRGKGAKEGARWSVALRYGKPVSTPECQNAECGARGAEIGETRSERTMSLRLAPAHSEFRILYSAFPIRRCG